MMAAEISRMIDVSCVQAQSTLDEIAQSIAMAKRFPVAAVFVLPSHVPYALELAGGADIVIGATAGFPSGSASTATKTQEVAQQRKLGCREFDMVNNITWLKAGKDDLYRQDIAAVVAEAQGMPVKVILECHYLSDAEIVRACNLAVEAGAAFVKTATGWAPTGATLENIKLIKQTVGDRCSVKAAGGVRGLETILAMHRLGATRFGISVKAARSILEGLSTSTGSDY
ncbi:MAG: deoxyribose-phosphate aldolase [Planctomycetaceae bacterium]|nr:deoxyribose-phosphate aldolase [Planctomycetaceae bacterium]